MRMQNVECRMQNAESRITDHASRVTHHASRFTSAFTMIEIAISLAIIGFALVAIIGVLPIGMNVQKDNREQTVINQDATVWMNALRNGAEGLDDLTNYVMAITNYVTEYKSDMTSVVQTWTNWYTPTAPSGPNSFPLVNGFRIVGLLSTPKYVTLENGDVVRNHVAAYVRSMSGPASEKFPQNSPDVQDFAFSYRMTSEVVPCGTNYYDPSWTNYTFYATNTVEYATGLNQWIAARNMAANLHDLRLTFRWPLRSRGMLGQGGQSFRTLVGGSLQVRDDLGYNLYFFQPGTFTNSPTGF